MQLSATGDPEAHTWDVSLDGSWLGDGPGDRTPVDFPALPEGPFDSARLVAVWLANGDVYSLAAIRPKGAKGQDRDEITAGFPAEGEEQAFDPRLSTEYAQDGTPRRTGLELWIGEDPDGPQRPLRLGAKVRPGESLAPRPGVSAHRLDAHHNGIPGIGVYILVTG